MSVRKVRRALRFAGYAISKITQRQILTKPNFVVGLNNSGTTTFVHSLRQSFNFVGPEIEVQAALGSRRALRAPNEQKALYARIFASNEYFDMFHLTRRDLDIRGQFEMYEFYSNWSDGGRYIDKNPYSTLKIGYLRSAFPDAYFVGVVRHPLAVCEGIMRMRLRRNLPEKKVVPMSWNHDLPERAALHWLNGNRTMIQDGEEAGRFILVKYEDFVRNPKKVLMDVGAFCDVDDPFSLELGVSGNGQGRALVSDRNPHQIERLDDETKDRIWNIVLPISGSLGYSP